jgi:hypothetical protein
VRETDEAGDLTRRIIIMPLPDGVAVIDMFPSEARQRIER